MKQIIKTIHSKLKDWYYYQELKELSAAAFAIFLVRFLYNYGKIILDWVFTEKGQLYTVFFMAGVVICIAIKMYYRVMVIKYHDIDTQIELFSELNKE
jgi:hypothetical protein